ncbi:MAG: 50S ribosomal protein L25 [Coriobacteriaceae bacterium]|nr:50S ribosomal protein L25 [Coriobacteriaceae bacterium]
MTETYQMQAHRRDVIGKANRRLAGQNLVPAVLYGTGREAMAIALDRHDLELALVHSGGHTAMYKLKIEGEDQPVDAVIKTHQTNPVKGTLLHVDFLAVRADQTIHAAIPLHIVGDSVGVRAGGVVATNLREINVEALPMDLPDHIEADITPLEVGMNIHVSDLVIPAGVTVLDEAETVVCSVVAPRVEVEEEVVEEAVEPEVIGEKPEEAAEE